MAKALPYFRWYPADAETDEAYSALNDLELGFFHRCLNRAWLNNGLPSDPDEISRIMKVEREYLDKVWPRVSKMFKPQVDDLSRIVNRRQEEERNAALDKSEKNKRVGNANATRGKRDREFHANDSRSVSNAIDPQHAQAGAVSVFVSESEVKTEKSVHEKTAGLKVVKSTETSSDRFKEFWDRYPVKDNQQIAFGVWDGLVTTQNETKVFACLDRYLASDRGARSPKNPANWLHDCARDKWESDWPKARDSPPSKTEIQGTIYNYLR